jgi:peptidoglycan/xylan/chitin deacetylase (PgdA/CDA1 family)
MPDQNRTERRAFLATVAAAGVGLAGCSSFTGGGDSGTDTPTGSATPSGTPSATPEATATDDSKQNVEEKQPNDPGSPKPMEPDAAAFEDVSYWSAQAGVKLNADSKTYYQGTQSARVEGRSGSIQRTFPVPLDLSDRDISLAMKVDGPLPTNIRIWLFDTAGNKTRLLQRLHGRQTQGWVRINPSINTTNADMSRIQKMLITIDGPADSKKYWVDDIRFHDKAAKKGQVMFTFDYITRSIYEVAYPIMKDKGIKGAVAVPVDNVGNADRLTYDELKELKDDGWEIMSMTNDWASLYGQSKNIQRKRMERAIRLLDDNGLGKPAAMVYPKGFCDATSLELADELHDLAFVRYSASEAGLSQSAIMGPNFVNRSRPNTPEAAANQMAPAQDYRGLYTIAHSKIGPDAQNSRSEFQAMVNEVDKRQKQGDLEVVLPSDVVLK